MTTLGLEIKRVADGILDDPPWYGSVVTAFFVISLAVNLLVTALIVYKIIVVYNDIRVFSTRNVQTNHDAYGNGRRDLYPVLSILIESGLMTFVGQLVQSIMYTTTIPGFPLVSGPVVMLYVRASRLLILCRNFIYFTGDFDDNRPCACRDGHYLRS